jgi:drug/metabolite transporter (DMT)-like permease
MLAGVLRTTTSFWPSPEPSVALELLYLVIDALILFGVLGVYSFQSEKAGAWGLIGFLLAIVGTAIIVGPDGRIGRVDMYTAGSLLLGVGLVCLAVGSWKARCLPRWVPVLWVFSTTVGIVGAIARLPALFMVAGVAFGVAFIGAGATVWFRGTPANQRMHPTTPASP